MKDKIVPKKSPLVSIIIPLYAVCDRFFQDLRHFDNLNYHNYEILIICDKKIKIPVIKNAKVILTGLKQTGPAEKRDIAVNYAKGQICAFIDDDAYPDVNWLNTAIHHFTVNKNIIGVGGPGITPPDDSRMAQLGGLVYESKYTSGRLKMRFVSLGNETKEIVDWPAYNLFIKTDIIKKIGGWGSTFYGGEDTYICLKMNPYGRMIYEPKAIVYHHRRPLFYSHIKQIINVGIHRGYFFKKYPETSRQAFYLLPTILTAGFWFLCIYSFFSTLALVVFLISFIIFFGMALSTVLNKTDTFGVLNASFGILLTHMAYGVGFIKGILAKNLKR